MDIVTRYQKIFFEKSTLREKEARGYREERVHITCTTS